MAKRIGGEIVSLQGLRGVAALLVLLAHSSTIAGSGKYLDHDPTHGLFLFGSSGVYLFFVLSGFIIAHVHADDVGRPGAAGRYLWRRFARIYPFYWVVLAVALAVRVAAPDLNVGGRISPASLAAGVLLVPLPSSQPVVGVAWTLLHEVLFYAAFGLMVATPRLGGLVMAAWLTGSAASFAADPAGSVTFSGYHVLFAFGMAAAWAYRRDKIPAPLPVAAFGIAGFLASAVAQLVGLMDLPETPARALPYGLASMLLIIGLAAAERRGAALTPRPIAWLGNASYSIYLTHYFVLSDASKALAGSGLAVRLPAWVGWAISVTSAVSVGLLCHLAIERPLLRWSRRPSLVPTVTAA